MSVKTEALHAGEFILSEAPGSQSREQITVKSGENLVAGQVVAGYVTAATVTGAAGGKAGTSNTGNGTIGTLSAGATAKEGTYLITFLHEDTNLGDFTVEDPDGINIGNGIVGTAFTGDIVFTITDGSTDMVGGDQFTVTVSQSTVKYVALPNDGTKDPAGILYAAVDASGADTKGVLVARNAEVTSAALTWPSGISAATKDIAITLLAKLGIVLR